MADDGYQKEFGIAVKRRRKDKRYSQDQFAEISDLSPGYLSAVERGLANPRLDTIKKIANGFGISVADLFSFELVDSEPRAVKTKLLEFIQNADAGKVEAVFASFMGAVLKK